MTTQTYFTDDDLRIALRQGVPASVVTRQVIRQRKDREHFRRLELAAAKNDVTPIYFHTNMTHAKPSLARRIAAWIKTVVR